MLYKHEMHLKSISFILQTIQMNTATASGHTRCIYVDISLYFVFAHQQLVTQAKPQPHGHMTEQRLETINTLYT